MATYEDLLRLQKPSPARGFAQAVSTLGARLQDKSPQQEDTSARDLMGKILISQIEQERAQADADVKRQQQLEDMETKHLNALELARTKESIKPPKPAQIAGTGQPTGQRSFANIGGQNVPVRPFTETRLKVPNLTEKDFKFLGNQVGQETADVIRQVNSEADLQELLNDMVNSPQEFADAGVDVNRVLSHFGLSDVGLKEEPVIPQAPSIIDRIKGLF